MKKSERASQVGAGSQPLEEVVAEYLRHIRFGAGYSKSTCKAYGAQLRRFVRWLQRRLDRPPRLSDVTASLFREYVMELSEGGRRPRTVRSAGMPVRGLLAHLVEIKALESSPIHSIRLPKQDAAQRPQVADEELLALLAGCERLAGVERSAMATALTLVLITTAVRRSELLSLRVADVNLEAAQLLIAHGKGAKARVVFMPPETVAALEAWLRVRPACEHDYLFTVDKRRRLANNGLDTLLEAIKAAAGLRHRENIKPHSIRHAAATRLLRRGADLKSIQTLLGHASLSTTAVYLHTDEEQLRSVARLASLQPDDPHAARTSPAGEQPDVDTELEGERAPRNIPLAKRPEQAPENAKGMSGGQDPAVRMRSVPGPGKPDAAIRKLNPPSSCDAAGKSVRPSADRPEHASRRAAWMLKRRRRPPST